MNSKDILNDARFSFCFARIGEIDSPLFAEEINYIRKAVPKRQREFLAGRQAARVALAGLGIVDAIIPVGSNRMPIFPDQTVGSISHTDDHVAAVAAKAENIRAVGIDIEKIGRVTEDLWPIIFTLSEINYIKKAKCDFLPTLLFSAKEAYFKMQYPMSNKMIDFKVVEVFADQYDNKLLIKNKNFSCLGFYFLKDENVCTLFYMH